ncbi:MAG TPA: DegT/DnrJ/EryC1/StrS family aminotransferase [Candidatus Sumerlaeota bacterium]|nr:MAG: UDP-4-amino-4-deoxy-L-arabinose--oxoglutarate aminotransferase [candidate division BRC1 bacterium ADurb.Bin183]HOE62465.1 DegT/DnrJ/EryC1/StrS family aminotransferase [Candidatus Sumerlaeota bacterium]HRR31945.1 DegT/DnrJ/EryC1/StrS family aminotransferase [Candidatus Sumerlaeia bacterium]HON50094.1 DegT/DnrJ/EryC1/StrS family aminotransferase [Candidatus Sumerlaeota bacterium]HOR63310.1 DegT/DnrJ/EryC1/StrS family aminotransferase [Candidatus Sumerlaeota bacterium]
MNRKIFLSDMEYGIEEERAVVAVLRERWLTMGPRTAQFEKAFSKKIDGAHALFVSSGTTALHLAVYALGLGKGDEMILPSLTFAATANVAVQCGAQCVFADIEDVEVPLLSPKDVARKITPRTRIVMPVHYAGFAVNMKKLCEIVEKERKRRHRAGEKRPLYIVEDAAHAAGARDQSGKPLGILGDAGCFSLFSNKNIATGEGGIIATKDESLYKRLILLRSHGLTRQTWERHKSGNKDYESLYNLSEPGFNYRPTEIAAALGIEQLKKLARINKIREKLFKYVYTKLHDAKNFVLPFKGLQSWGDPSYHILPILAADNATRLRVVASLNDAGIQTSHHYRPVHTMSYYQKKYPKAGLSLPKTVEYAEREITLPLHTKLTKQDMDYIIDALFKSVP